jgi:hypothetical protein
MPVSSEELRERIQRTKPWLKTRGATTELGRAIVGTNSLKRGLRSKNALIREAARYWERQANCAQGDWENFKRRCRPFAIANLELPFPLLAVLYYLKRDPQQFCEELRQQADTEL